jgi:hypothetical protein
MGRLSRADFPTLHGLRRSESCFRTPVRGMNYPFTLPRFSGIKCCPSSLYTFPADI